MVRMKVRGSVLGGVALLLACGRPPVPPPIGETAGCPSDLDVPDLLRRHGQLYGTERDIQSLVPFSVVGDESGWMTATLVDRGRHSHVVFRGQDLPVADGVDERGPWAYVGGVRLKLLPDEAQEPLFEGWMQRRQYISSFEPARDSFVCEVVDSLLGVVLRYRLPQLGNPELAFDVGGTLLSATHTRVDGQKATLHFHGWTRRAKRPKTDELQPVDAGSAAGAAWPDEVIDDFRGWRVRTTQVLDHAACTWRMIGPPGETAPPSDCLHEPRDHLRVEMPPGGITMPFKRLYDEVLVSTQIGDVFLDTGASAFVLPGPSTAFHRRMQVRMQAASSVMSADLGELDELTLRAPYASHDLRLFHVPTVQVLSLREVLDEMATVPPTMILGLPLFLFGPVRIDYQKELVVLGGLPSAGATAIPLHVWGEQLVVEGALGDASASFLLDTGSGHAFSLREGWATTHGFPGDRRQVEVAQGEASGITKALAFRADHATFGPIAADGIVAHVHASPLANTRIAGEIGNQLLARCSAIVIDVPARKLWLEPPCDRPVPESHAGFGFSFRLPPSADPSKPAARSWVVLIVPPGGPGARAGILVGDEILSIDGIPTPPDPDPWVEVLERPPGTRVPIVVKRNGDVKTLSLVLEVFP